MLSHSCLLDILPRYYGKLACDQSCHQKNKECNPILPARNDKGIQGGHEEKIEREKGNHRCQKRSIATAYACQSQDDQQVDNRNIGDGWIQMVGVNDARHRQRSSHCQEAINEILLPVLLCRHWQLWNVFYGTHRSLFLIN